MTQMSSTKRGIYREVDFKFGKREHWGMSVIITEPMARAMKIKSKS